MSLSCYSACQRQRKADTLFFSATVFFVVLQGLGVISKPLQPICTMGYSKTFILLMIPV